MPEQRRRSNKSGPLTQPTPDEVSDTPLRMKVVSRLFAMLVQVIVLQVFRDSFGH